MSALFRKQQKQNETKETLVDFMKNNKTEWAYRLLESIDETVFNAPDYIEQAINWIREDAK